jgi:putative GTP pyrophosphokinase
MQAALRVLAEYRAGFRDPLRKVTLCVADFAMQESSQPVVTARPKTVDRIVGKLVRLATMRLSQMEDIGGCRAKLPGGMSEVRAILHRIQDTWPDADVIDYVAEPKATGYRALHVLREQDGRMIEIQLRTAGQNRWADVVEATADRLGYALKDGKGPPELARYFERAAYKIALEEEGGSVDEAFTREFASLREQVRPYFSSG